MNSSFSKTFLALQSLTQRHRGVFTIHDLENLFLTSSAVEIQQKLKPFLKEKIIHRFCRGFYVAGEFDIEYLSQRISPHSAISLGSVLAKEMIIGSTPKKTVYAVKIGKSRIYRSKLGQIVHLGFGAKGEASQAWFGYDTLINGIKYANKEKAFLDVLYFYQKGHKFSFNIYSDMNTERLDKKIIADYLGRYKNPKFRKFAEGIIHEKHTIR